MLTAAVWNKNRTDITEVKNVRLCQAGVILPVLRDGTHTEVLFPWHRVHDVYGGTPGEIALELGQ